jgi:hypothetical protein
MSILRSQLGRSPALITYAGATLFTRSDIMVPHDPKWTEIKSSMFGLDDRFKADLVIKVPLTLYGNWDSLPVLFPSYAMSPTPGTSIYGAADVPLVLQGRNNDRITYTNAQITKLGDLFLGVDEELWAAAVEMTAILGNGQNPEGAGAYFVRDTAAYSDGAFSRANFQKARFTGNWSGMTGFGSVVGQKGFHVAWKLDAKPLVCDGYGTVDFTVGDNVMSAACKCIPIGPTGAQIDTQQQISQPHGQRQSQASADLILASAGHSITLKTAAIASHSVAWGAEALRVNETNWETTRSISAGAAAAVASVA